MHVSLLSGSRRHPRHAERGLALVITLFVVALVTVLVLEYHFDASVELDLADNYGKDVQAYHLAMAGLRFAQALLQADKADADGPEDPWSLLGLVPACYSPQQLIDLATQGLASGTAADRVAAKTAAEQQRLTESRREERPRALEGCVRLVITDENSKLPVNALRPVVNADGTQTVPTPWGDIFQAFLVSFQIDPDVLDALIDWIDEDENPRGGGGAEKSAYSSLPIPYEPPNKLMRTPGELRLVKGLNEPETLAKLFPGVPPEAVSGLDLGQNAYLTPFTMDQPPTVTPTLAPQPPTPTPPPPNPRTPPTPPAAPPPNTGGRVNLNTVSPEVLRAIITGAQPNRSGSAEAEADDIVARRQEKQFKSVNEAIPDATLRTALGNVVDVKSTHFRVESVGTLGIIQKKVVAVLKRPQTTGGLGGNQMTIVYFKVE